MTGTEKGKPATLGSFHGDLEQLLVQQLKDNPRHHHLRLKLLELYYETGRREDFLSEARRLTAGFDKKLQSAEWKRICSMARMLALRDPLFQTETEDSIEFISSDAKAEPAKSPKIRRFGDDDAHRRYFQEIAAEYEKLRSDVRFLAEFDVELMHLANRPSSLLHARRLSQKIGGAQIHLKREDLSPPGSRLMMSVVGQALLARRLKKTMLVTATINGLKGVVTASVAARFGLRAVVFMDQDDAQRQAAHAFRMRLLGATVTTLDKRRTASGDVREKALEFWARHSGESLLVMGLDAAPHPYPMMTREFSAVIGRETRRQATVQSRRVPDVLVARAGHNADAIGFFEPFLAEPGTRLVCVEGGRDLAGSGTLVDVDPFERARRGLSVAEKRVAGAILEGLEYPSVVREHEFLRASGRVEYIKYTKASTAAAKKAIQELAQQEGVVAAVETAHALAWAFSAAKTLKPDQVMVVMMAESGEKDIWEIAKSMGELV